MTRSAIDQVNASFTVQSGHGNPPGRDDQEANLLALLRHEIARCPDEYNALNACAKRIIKLIREYGDK